MGERMTIDEAITLLRFNNKHIADLKNDDLQQLAEWLEDYKRLKSIPEHNYYNCHNLTCRRKCEKDGYNKAIDDAMNVLENECHLDKILFEKDIFKRLEQLKAGEVE